jgi:solute carrier family 35 protein F5
MVTWCCTSFFALYLVIPFFKALYRVIRHQDRFYLMEAPIFISDEDRQPGFGNEPVSPLSSLISLRTDTSKLDERETFKLAAFFVVIWFGANYSINAGLSLTSVSSATILATTSGLSWFTCHAGISLILLKASSLYCSGTCLDLDDLPYSNCLLSFQGSSLLRLFNELSTPSMNSLAGVALICTKDNEMSSTTVSTSSRLLGDGLSLLSALLYACYVSLLKVTVKDESKLNTGLFFGFVGALNILCLWPLGLVLHFTGVETFELPGKKEVIAGMVVNGLITLCVRLRSARIQLNWAGAAHRTTSM